MTKLEKEAVEKYKTKPIGYESNFELNIYTDGYKDGATTICKKILEEVRTHEGIEQMTKFYIGEIIKNLGVDIDD